MLKSYFCRIFEINELFTCCIGKYPLKIGFLNFCGPYKLLEQCKIVFQKNLVLEYFRESPRSQGASLGVCGSGVPPHDFLNLYGVSDSRFSISFSLRNGSN